MKSVLRVVGRFFCMCLYISTLIQTKWGNDCELIAGNFEHLVWVMSNIMFIIYHIYNVIKYQKKLKFLCLSHSGPWWFVRLEKMLCTRRIIKNIIKEFFFNSNHNAVLLSVKCIFSVIMLILVFVIILKPHIKFFYIEWNYFNGFWIFIL